MDQDDPRWIRVLDLIAVWYRRARESQMTHYAVARRYASWSRWLGSSSATLSAAAGTTLFATFRQPSTPVQLQFGVGIVTFFAGILGALNTFLGLSERARSHVSVASAYGAVRREIEQMQVSTPVSIDVANEAVGQIRRRLDGISETAPTPPKWAWRAARKDISGTTMPEGFVRP